MSEWREVDFGRIPISWEIKTIDSLRSEEERAIAMGPFGSNIKAENFVDTGVPVIRGTNFNYDKYVDGDFVFLTDEKADNLIGSNCKPNDLVFTHRGTIGQVGLIPENTYERYVISQSGMKLTVNSNLIDYEFLFYFFKSKYGQFQILKYESQVGVPSISNPLTSLKEIEVPVPPLPEQKAIAEVLSSLDDKIDLLHRQNKTLEQMAETLFRQWFVEEAQEDWEEKQLSEYFELLGGFAFKSKDYLDTGQYKVITIKGVQDGFLDTSSAARLNVIPEKVKSYQVLELGDILMSLTGNVGRVCLVDENNCLLNQRVAKIEPLNKRWKPFSYFYFRQRDMIERLTYLSKGSAQLNLSPVETVNQVDLFSDDSVIDRYCDKVTPMYEKIIKNKIQIHTLEKLRDTLLPKLMSGEVRVN